MKNLNRNAYTEEIIIATDILLLGLMIILIIFEFKINKPFFQGLFVGFLLYGWLPNFLLHFLKLKSKYLKVKLKKSLDKLKELLEINRDKMK